jgi:Zn-dependent protease with chaperone function
MREREYYARIRRAEEELHRDPERYRQRLSRLLLLGDLTAWLLLGLLLTTALGVGAAAWQHHALWALLLGGKLIFPILALWWFLLRALLIGADLPAGLPLDPRKTPNLHTLIREYQNRFHTPPVDRIFLDFDFNAAVLTLPRSLLPGRDRTVLILGIPLMASLTPEEFRAVLAHEFGHIRRDHGRFAYRLYRNRQRWDLLYRTYGELSDWSLWPIRRFLDYYVPRLDSYAFAMLRRQEYEADQSAAETMGAECVASALIRTALCSEELDRNYWRSFAARAAEEPQPPPDPFRGLRDFLKTRRVSSDDVAGKIDRLLRNAGGYDDTHPSLKDRLDALGASPRLPERNASALEHFLAPDTEEILEACDRSYRETIASWWVARRRELLRGKDLLESYRKRPEESLTPAERRHRALLLETLSEEEKACNAFRRLEKDGDDHPELHYRLAQCLSSHRSDRILERLFRALESPYRFEEARAWGYRLIDPSDTKTLARWQETIEREAQRHDEWLRTLDVPTRITPLPPTDPADIEIFRQFLETEPSIEAAWIACRTVPARPHYPLYLIAVEIKGEFFRDRESLVTELYRRGPDEPAYRILPLAGSRKVEAETIRNIGTAIVLPKDTTQKEDSKAHPWEELF